MLTLYELYGGGLGGWVYCEDLTLDGSLQPLSHLDTDGSGGLIGRVRWDTSYGGGVDCARYPFWYFQL